MLKAKGNNFLNILNEHVNNYGFPYVILGIYLILNYASDYFLFVIFDKQDDPFFFTELIGLLLSIVLVLKKYWPNKIKKFYGFYWYALITWCMPYLETFRYLHSPTMHSTFILPDALLSIFTLILIMDWKSFLVVLFSGVILGFLAQYIFYGLPHSYPLMISYELFTYYIMVSIVLGILFARNASRFRANLILQQQLSTIQTVCASIAHELRTPLLSIKSGAAGIKHFLPRLLETYKIAQEHNLKIPEVREGHLNSMTQVMNNIDSEVDFSNDVITSLLTNAMHNNVSLNPKLQYDIASTVKAALLRYHFNPASQIEVVHFDEANNFVYHADEILVTHIIFNLLKNAIYAIEEMRKGEIFITLAHEKNYNCLYFKDTAKGMSKETQSNLFQAFYTEKPNNTGIGLAFSKMVMDNLGGEIAVDSVLGEYAEFVLRFPIVKYSAKG